MPINAIVNLFIDRITPSNAVRGFHVKKKITELFVNDERHYESLRSPEEPSRGNTMPVTNENTIKPSTLNSEAATTCEDIICAVEKQKKKNKKNQKKKKITITIWNSNSTVRLVTHQILWKHVANHVERGVEWARNCANVGRTRRHRQNVCFFVGDDSARIQGGNEK